MKLSKLFEVQPKHVPERLIKPEDLSKPNWAAGNQSAGSVFNQPNDPLKQVLQHTHDVNPDLNDLNESQIKSAANAIVQRYASKIDTDTLSCYEFLILEMFVKTGMFDPETRQLVEGAMNDVSQQGDALKPIQDKGLSAWNAFYNVLFRYGITSGDLMIDPSEFRSKLTDFIASFSELNNNALVPIYNKLQNSLPVFLAKFSVIELPQLCDDFRSFIPDGAKIDALYAKFWRYAAATQDELPIEEFEKHVFPRFSSNSEWIEIVRKFSMDYFSLNMGLSLISLTKSLINKLINSPEVDIKDAALVLNAVTIIAGREILVRYK